MSVPKVSVIIPSYNHEAFIERAIFSVLEQSHKNIELIVIDDGSKDGSPVLLSKLQATRDFKLVLKDNEGLAKTVNKGLEIATGEFVVILGSDDIMPLNRIAEQIVTFEAHPEADVVAGAVTKIKLDDSPFSTELPKKLGWLEFEEMAFKNFVLAPTAMIRSSVFSRWGSYDPSIQIEDYYLWMKILDQGGKILNTSHIWALYRTGPENLAKKMKWYFSGAREVLSLYKDRPLVKTAIKNLSFKYALKMVLLKGTKAFSEDKDPIEQLPSSQRAFLNMLCLLPNKLRQLVLTKHYG